MNWIKYTEFSINDPDEVEDEDDVFVLLFFVCDLGIVSWASELCLCLYICSLYLLDCFYL